MTPAMQNSKKGEGLGEMAQVVKDLFFTCEDVDFIHGIHVQRASCGGAHV